MSKRDKKDYRIGYAKPPAEHQFKKGKSGNPRGRPKKKSELLPQTEPSNNILLEELYRTITVREGDQTVDMSMLQAIIRAMTTGAAKGNRFLMRETINAAAVLEAVKAEEAQKSIDFWKKYKSDGLAEIKRCKERGMDAPDLLPHPEDVIIDYGRREVRFDGPIDEEDRADLDRRIAKRRYALLLGVYSGEFGKGIDPTKIPFWSLIANILNNALPKRVQHSPEDMASTTMGDLGQPRRALYREIRELAVRLGMEVIPPSVFSRPLLIPPEMLGGEIRDGRPHVTPEGLRRAMRSLAREED